MVTFNWEHVARVAKEMFGLELPMQEAELKRAWRRECKRLHPDVNPTRDHSAIARVNDAYQYLLSFLGSKAFIDSVTNEQTKTMDGYDIALLGRGLPANMNGSRCHRCNGAGYETKLMRYERATCTHQTPCIPCKGSGQFILRNNNRVQCKRCQGRGQSTHDDACYLCLLENNVKPVYCRFRCFTCEGTGEVRIFNPVIKKTAILKGA